MATEQQIRRDRFIVAVNMALNIPALTAPHKNHEHVNATFVECWDILDWPDLPDDQRKLIDKSVEKYRANAMAINNVINQVTRKTISEESFQLLGQIKEVLVDNNLAKP